MLRRPQDASKRVVRGEAADLEAAVLWFDPDRRSGAVETDDGRHLRFVGSQLPFVPEPGRKVRVVLTPGASTLAEQVQLLPLQDGRRVVVQLEQITVTCALDRDRPVGPDRPPGSAAPRLLVAAPAPARGSGGGGGRRGPRRKYPARRAGEALAVGSLVVHPTYGHGFVELSTSRVARVRFGGQERQVRVAELETVEE